jgi:hypothetical protein
MIPALWLLGLLAGVSEVTPPEQVAVEWHGISDAMIVRCGLQQLHQKLLVRLIEEGYAIVDSSVGPDLDVVLSSDEGSLTTWAHRGGASLSQAFLVGAPCDSTLQLQVVYEVIRMLSELPREEPVPTLPAAEPSVRAAVAETPDEFWAGSGVFVPGTLAAAPYARFDFRWYLSEAVALQGGVESSFFKTGGLLIWEPAVSLQLAVEAYTFGSSSVRVGMTSALLQHRSFFGGTASYHWDARLGGYAGVGFGIWEAYVSPTVRFVPTRHLMDGREVYRVAPLGVVVGLGAKLFGG